MEFYTTRPEDVAVAHISGWPLKRYAIEDDFTGHWQLQVEFKSGSDDVVYTGRRFRAVTKEEAESKAEESFRRLIAKYGKGLQKQSGAAVSTQKAAERRQVRATNA